MKKKIWSVYILALHFIIISFFLFPDYVNKIYKKTGIQQYSTGHEYYIDFIWYSYANRSKTLKKESEQLIFFGNSITNGLCVESIFNGVNMGISGETIENAKSKIKDIHNLENKRIIVAYGINDIPRNAKEIIEDYHEFISFLPESSTIYLSSVLPVNEEAHTKSMENTKMNQQIIELNEHLKNYSRTKSNIIFIDASKYLFDSEGELGNSFHLGDGLHLNKAGNLNWAKGLSEGINDNSPKFISKTGF